MKKTFFAFLFLAFMKFSFCQTQSELNDQANQNFLKADKELNSVYQKILKEYKSDTAFIKNLKAAQKIWIQFRDAELNMKFPSVKEYGSVFPVCWFMYKEQLTRQRIKILKEWLEGVLEEDVCAGSTKIEND